MYSILLPYVPSCFHFLTPLLIYFFISTSSISRCQLLVIVNVCVQASVCCTPWMLSICPSFNAAPLTLHRVRTMRSALASDRKGLESRTPFLFSPAEAQNREQWLTSKVKIDLPVLIHYVGFFYLAAYPGNIRSNSVTSGATSWLNRSTKGG